MLSQLLESVGLLGIDKITALLEYAIARQDLHTLGEVSIQLFLVGAGYQSLMCDKVFQNITEKGWKDSK